MMHWARKVLLHLVLEEGIDAFFAKRAPVFTAGRGFSSRR